MEEHAPDQTNARVEQGMQVIAAKHVSEHEHNFF